MSTPNDAKPTAMATRRGLGPFRPSISNALASAVILLMVGSYLAGFFIIRKAFVTEARLRESEIAETKLESTRHSIEIWIEGRIDALRRQASYPAVVHAAMNPQSGLETVVPLLEDANRGKEGASIRLLDFQGDLLTSHGPLDGDALDRDEIREILVGRRAHSAHVTSAGTGPRLRLVVPVLRLTDDPSSVEGALVGELDARELTEAVASWKPGQYGWLELASNSLPFASFGEPQPTRQRTVRVGDTGISVRFAIDPSATEQVVATARQRLGVVFIVFALGGSLAVWLIARVTIRNPIESLLQGMKRARAGERGVRISEAQGFSDTHLLARDYNLLVSSLEMAQTELASVNEGLEDRIRMRTSELEQRNSELQDFAHVASHDLQEPLRKVTVFCEMALERCQSIIDEQSRDYLGHAVRGAHRMRRLINDLLDYSQLSADSVPTREVSMGSVLEEVIENLETVIDASGTEIQWDELPVLHHHRVRVVQLFQNLISNAIKYRSEDAPRIHVSASQHGNTWHFRLEDNGKGIDPRYSERVFEVFQRLESRRDTEGTGIGLALCRKIVERRGGRIWFEAAPLRGTVFEFTVPVEPPGEAQPA